MIKVMEFRVVETETGVIATTVDIEDGEGTGEYVVCVMDDEGTWVEVERRVV